MFDQFGSSDVLYYGDSAKPELSPEDVLVETKAIGMNFADVYRRKGNYHIDGEPPYVLGYEGAGVVVEVGSKISDIKVGDRIAFADVPYANAQMVAVPYDKAIPLPDAISFEVGASLLLQGLTAQYLSRDSYRIKEGDLVLIHAVAGGVGQILTQLAKHERAIVIGLTSSESKREKALANGAGEVFLYHDDWLQQVLDYSGGNGVNVAYDSVGSTLMDSFRATQTCGTVVFYGMAGGDPEKIDPRMLMDTSKTLVGGDLWHHVTCREERIQRASQLFRLISDGELRVNVCKKFKLSEGKLAHDYLESRKSVGKVLLIP